MTVQGIIGKKVGMTQLFVDGGSVAQVTAVQAGPCTVTQVRTTVRDGYEAVQLGFEETQRANRPEAGHLKRAGRQLRHLHEVSAGDLGDIQVGQQIDVGIFEPGQIVDVTGISKGRGFQGGIKRHGFARGPKTHGQSDRERAPGSIGAGTFPGRVLKGQRMPGHMGARRVTVPNLEIVKVDQERNILFLKGAVPGARDGLLFIRKVSKRRRQMVSDGSAS